MLVSQSVVSSKIISELIKCKLIVQRSIIELALEGCRLQFLQYNLDSNLSTAALEDQSRRLLEFLVNHDAECELTRLVAGKRKLLLCLLNVVIIDMDVLVQTKLTAVDIVVLNSRKSVIGSVDNRFLIHAVCKSLSDMHVVKSRLLHLHRHVQHDHVRSLDQFQVAVRLDSLKISGGRVDADIDLDSLKRDKSC